MWCNSLLVRLGLMGPTSERILGISTMAHPNSVLMPSDPPYPGWWAGYWKSEQPLLPQWSTLHMNTFFLPGLVLGWTSTVLSSFGTTLHLVPRFLMYSCSIPQLHLLGCCYQWSSFIWLEPPRRSPWIAMNLHRKPCGTHKDNTLCLAATALVDWVLENSGPNKLWPGSRTQVLVPYDDRVMWPFSVFPFLWPYTYTWSNFVSTGWLTGMLEWST